MPALITHYLFGEEALSRGHIALPGTDGYAEAAPEGCPASDAHRVDAACTAFYLGCQGPDPFFFAVTTLRGPAVRAMGSAMHRRLVGRAFDHLRSSIERLPAPERPVGRAFVLGLLAHYALDRTAHPYVHAMEQELCRDPDLAGARPEVHAVIESEIDCGMLDRYRDRTVASFPPVAVLDKDLRATRAAGALTASLAGEVFGLALRPTDYEGALDDMRLCYRLIEPYGSKRGRRLAALERAVRTHSYLASLAHRADQGAGNPSMNPGHRPWKDPFKGDVSTESFPEVFERALDGYADLAARYLAGEAGERLTGRLDYSGRTEGRNGESKTAEG